MDNKIKNTNSCVNIKVLAFDVFGTVADWRSSIISLAPDLRAYYGISLDWSSFADAWRAEYQPSMELVRSGKKEFLTLDKLHWNSLKKVLAEFGEPKPPNDLLVGLNKIWDQLMPWPDVVPGLKLLKKHFILTTLSNGNISMMVNMAKHSCLPWDVILGAEISQCYKPQLEVYRHASEILNIPPSEFLMVAAHNNDLKASSQVGFKTCFIPRPKEYGNKQKTDLYPENDYDIVASDFIDLARKLEAN